MKIQENARVGIFGGTFNPPHVAHTACIQVAHQRMKLDQIFVVPNARNPLKPQVEGPTDAQRVAMLELGFEEFKDFVAIDTQEIKRGGPSYMVETVRNYAKEVPASNLYLIIGGDQFEEFDRWKNFSEILELANLVVMSRPNYPSPRTAEEIPEGIRPLVGDFDRQFIHLHSGRSIEFLRLQDHDISSTDVRKRLRTGRNVDAQVSIPVEEYIRNEGIYAHIGPKVGDFSTFTKFCGQVLFDRKAIDVRGFDLRQAESASEFTLIASGTSTRHTASLAENVQRAVKEEFNVFPMSVEGAGEGRWVVLDYGSLIIHLFYDFVRQEYRLEDLWRQGKDLELRDQAPASAAPARA